MPTSKQKNHQPVLMQEVLTVLQPKKGESYLDLTAGYGGHASEITAISRTEPTLVDRDENAIASLREVFNDKARLLHADFLSASKQLLDNSESFDLILADLGVSSPHLDNTSRGFSFQNDGLLDMRMDSRQKLTAAEIVNNAPKQELVRILTDYGQEPKARRIATLIIENRPFESTTQLAQIASKAWPGHSRVHPATRTFQALRIAVNDELTQLKLALPMWESLLAPGGRLAIISFHSLEDAIVKRFFNERGGNKYDATLEILTRKPIVASKPESVFNPRARSARLRASKRK